MSIKFFFFFSSRRRHTRSKRDWSSDVCSSDLGWHERRRHLVLEPLPRRAFRFRKLDLWLRLFQGADGGMGLEKIGRASCRGKSVDLGGRRNIKKKKKKKNIKTVLQYRLVTVIE